MQTARLLATVSPLHDPLYGAFQVPSSSDVFGADGMPTILDLTFGGVLRDELKAGSRSSQRGGRSYRPYITGNTSLGRPGNPQ